tara:strand:- start:442 stop:1545 length:1104 start_codon:yes stop_codon:yes gene_type:complete
MAKFSNSYIQSLVDMGQVSQADAEAGDFPDWAGVNQHEFGNPEGYDPTLLGYESLVDNRVDNRRYTNTNSVDTNIDTNTNTGGGDDMWTHPMPGYVQFAPGGAVYRMDGRSPEWIEANQHLAEVQQRYVPGMDWAEQFGTAPYIPQENFSFVNPAGKADDLRRQEAWMGAAGERIGGYTPYEQKQKDKYENHLWKLEMMRRQAALEQAAAMGGGGTFAQGSQQQGGQGSWQYDEYGNPYYVSDPIVPDEVSTYAAPPVITGEPSFGGDMALADPILELRSQGLGSLSPAARDALKSWFGDLGYTGTGQYGQYGEEEYRRPEGATGNIWFNPEDFQRFTDPTIKAYIEWLMGKMGYGTSTIWPGAAAA